MTTTPIQAPVRVDSLPMPTLPEPYAEWSAYAKRAGLLSVDGVAPAPMNAQTAYYAYSAAWNLIYPLIAERQSELERVGRNRDMWKEQCGNQAAALAAKEAEVVRLREALEHIQELVPNDAGYDGIHEAGDLCFIEAQKIANAALNPTQGETK